MIRPSCANCNIELTCLENEVILVHFLNNDRKQGIDICHLADLWGCKKCSSKVVLGQGRVMHDMDIIDQEIFLNNHTVIEVKR